MGNSPRGVTRCPKVLLSLSVASLMAQVNSFPWHALGVLHPECSKESSWLNSRENHLTNLQPQVNVSL